MTKVVDFEAEKRESISKMHADKKFRGLTNEWFNESIRHRYSYNFNWMGRPIIQYPQDVMALQEVIWEVKPDIIVETGIAHGGSLIFSASMLELLGGNRLVLGIDIDIRDHNRQAIESHPMAKRIKMIQGSSTSPETVEQVFKIAGQFRNPLVILDSNHTHEHVEKELDLYSPLVKKGSYLVVLDTVVENLPDELCGDRPWKPGDNPMTALKQFLKKSDRFIINEEVDQKLLISVAPNGFLRCVKD